MPAPNEDVPAFLRVEEWAQIEAYPSYWISDSGRVYSEHTEKVLSPYTNQLDEYFIVDLREDGDRDQRSVHTLVLEAHHRPPGPDEVAHHIDGDTFNNELSNLEWVTMEQNVEAAEDDRPVAPF
jgi:hypothetical protein